MSNAMTTMKLAEIHSLYLRDGFALLRTGVREEWILELLASHLGAVRGIWGKDYHVDYRPVQPERTDSVAQSSTELPPHTDGTFEMELPQSFILQSVCSDLPGYGISILVDGWKVVEKLSLEARNVLLTTKFRYYRSEMGKEATLIAPLLELHNNEYQIRFRNDRKHPLIPTSQAADAALNEFVEAMNNSDVRNEIYLEPGDILWVNNWRMIHGRSILSGNAERQVRRYWVQLAQSFSI